MLNQLWRMFSWIDVFENHVGAYVLRWRWLIIFLSAIAILTIGSGISKVTIDPSYRIFIEADHPQLLDYDRMDAEYSDSDGLIMAIDFGEGNTAFTERNLALLLEITELAWQTPNVARVDSLTNFQYVEAHGDELVVADLISEEMLSRKPLAELQRIAINEPALYHMLVSADARVAGLYLSLRTDEDDAANLASIDWLNEVRERVMASRSDVGVHLTGIAVLDNGINNAILHDLSGLIPGAGAVLLILMWLLCRNLAGTVLTALMIVLSLVVGVGATGHLGFVLGGPGVMAPIIILTIVAASCVHVLTSFLNLCRTGTELKPALIESLRVNFQPVTLTTLSTAIGFLTIMMSDVPAFRTLSILAFSGILASLWLVLFLFPALLSFFPARAFSNGPKTQQASMLGERMMQGLGVFVAHRRKVILAVMSLVMVLCISGLARIELNDDFVGFLSPRQPERIAQDFSNAHLIGFYSQQYEIRSGSEGGALDPAFLAEAEAFAQWLRDQPEVNHVLSLTDVMKRINRSMHGDEQAYYRLPEDRELAAQYFLFYEISLPYGLDLTNMVNIDRSALRMFVNYGEMSSKEVIEFDRRVAGWQRENFKNAEPRLGVGVLSIMSYLSLANAKNMLLVTAVALIAISCLLIVMLRSVRTGVISLIPNLVPAAMGFGIWGYMDGLITMPQSLVATMTLGIVVDDTVHFLSKYNRARNERGLSAQEAVIYSFKTVGQALVITSVMLVVSFLMLTQSMFNPNVYVGLLTAMVILFALIADFFFLPPILMLMDRKKTRVSSQQGPSN